MQRILPWYLLLITAFAVVPLAVYPPAMQPNEEAQFAVFALAVFLFTLYAIINIRVYATPLRQIQQRPSGLLLMLWLLFVCVYGVAVPEGLNITEGVPHLLRFVLLGCAFAGLSAGLSGLQEASFSVAFKIASVSAGFFAATGLVQTTGVFQVAGSGNVARGFESNEGMYAEQMCLMLPFLFSAVVWLRGGWQKVAGASLLLTLMVIVLSGVRTAWLQSAVFAVVLAGTLVWKRKYILTGLSAEQSIQMRKYLLTVAGSLVLMTTAFVLFIPGLGDRISKRISMSLQPQLENRISPTPESERLEMYGATVKLIRRHPFAGNGPGNWKFAAMSEGLSSRGSTFGDRFFHHPHNDILWVASEAGVPAAVFLLCFLLAVPIVALRGIRRAASPGKALALAACAAGAVSFFVPLNFSFPMSRTLQPLLLMVMAALVVSLYPAAEADAGTKTKRSMVVGIIFLILIQAGAVALSVHRLHSSKLLAESILAGKNGDFRQAAQLSGRAESFWYVSDETGFPVGYYTGSALLASGEAEKALAEFSRAYRVNPWQPQLLLRTAEAELAVKDTAGAVNTLQGAILHYPVFFEARLRLSEVFFLTHKKNDALRILSAGESFRDEMFFPNYMYYSGELKKKYLTP